MQPTEIIPVKQCLIWNKVGQMIMNSPAMQETWVQSLSWQDPLEEGMATPVFLPGESPWTQEPGGLRYMGSQRVRHDWVIFIFQQICIEHLLCARYCFFVCLFLNMYVFIYLVVLGLSRSTWNLWFFSDMQGLVPWPEIKPWSPALGGQSLSHWTTREVPRHCFKWCKYSCE